jgi:hypothetical protein
MLDHSMSNRLKLVVVGSIVLLMIVIGMSAFQCYAYLKLYNSIDITKTKTSQNSVFNGFRFGKGDEYDVFEKTFDIGVFIVETAIVWSEKRDRIVDKSYSVRLFGKIVYSKSPN